MAECVDCANKFASALAETLNVPGKLDTASLNKHHFLQTHCQSVLTFFCSYQIHKFLPAIYR